MKTRLRTLFMLWSGVYACIVSLFVTSCSDFFSDNDLDKKIQAAINYANAKSCTILIKTDSQYGEFLSDGEKQLKVNDTIDLQFTVNHETYIYKGMEVVNRKDQSVNMNDYVELTETGTDIEHSLGIYKIKVKLIKESDELLIRPACLLIPAVKNHIPSSSDPQYPTMPIIINFNLPVEFESEDIVLENLFEKEIISITNYGQDVSSYFETPVFNEQKTMLTLNPKRINYDSEGNPDGTSLYEYIGKQNSAFIELKVSFSREIGIKDEDSFIPLKEDSNSDFSIFYNKSKEDVAPEQYQLFVTKEIIDVEDALSRSSSIRFADDSFNLLQYETIFQNRTNGKIYIFGQYYDKDSGVNLIKVKEKRTNEPDGDEAYSEPIYDEIYALNDAKVSFINLGDGYTNFVLEYDLQSLDGAVLLTVSVIDGAGNESEEQSFTAIKKSFINLNAVDYYFSNDGFIPGDYGYEPYIDKKYETETQFDPDEYEATIKTLCFSADDFSGNYENEDTLCWFYSDYYLSWDCMTIACEYVHKDGKKYKEELIHKDNYCERMYWELPLDIDIIDGTFLKIIISDDMGNSGEFEYKIPLANNTVFNMEKNEASGIVNLFLSDGVPIEKQLKIKRNGENTPTAEVDWNNNTSINSGYDYLIAPCVVLDHGSFYLSIPQDKIYNMDFESSEVEDKVIEDEVYITRSSTKNYLDVTVSINKNNWEVFDAIYAVYSYSYYEWYNGSLYAYPRTKEVYYPKNVTSMTVQLQNLGLYNADAICELYGIKNNSLSTENEVKISKISGIEYDNISPKISYTRPSYDNEYLSLTVTDEHSQIVSGEALINGKKYNFIDNLKIYLWDINTVPDTRMTLHAEALDTAGNIGTYSIGEDLQFPPVTSIEKKGDKWYLYSRNQPGAVQSVNIGVWTLGPDGKWTYEGDKQYSLIRDSELDDETVCVIKNADLPADSIIKMKQRVSYHISQPTYFYTGEVGSGDYDLLMANGLSTTSVAISSDAPVFAHTVVTDLGYEECKNWSIEEWERYKKHIGDKYLDFSEDDHSAQRYSIPMSEIQSGECYAVIAHFSDNHAEMSQIFQKP